jgi:hypothetical protein
MLPIVLLSLGEDLLGKGHFWGVLVAFIACLGAKPTGILKPNVSKDMMGGGYLYNLDEREGGECRFFLLQEV